MTARRVYFIGAGPGDPDMLTLQGARSLEKCRTVFAPPPYEERFAERLAGKDVDIPFSYRFDDLIARLEDLLESQDVAFLIPGDLTFYSPFQPFVDALGSRAVVIPGVGTANAAAACLRKTLDLPDVSSRTVIVSPRTLGDDGSVSVRDLAAPGVTMLIYMNDIPLAQLVDDLRFGYGRSVPIAILHRLSLPGQEIILGTLDDIVSRVAGRDFFNLEGEDRRPALTLVVIGDSLVATADGGWWDYRHENRWKQRYGIKSR